MSSDDITSIDISYDKGDRYIFKMNETDLMVLRDMINVAISEHPEFLAWKSIGDKVLQHMKGY